MPNKTTLEVWWFVHNKDPGSGKEEVTLLKSFQDSHTLNWRHHIHRRLLCKVACLSQEWGWHSCVFCRAQQRMLLEVRRLSSWKSSLVLFGSEHPCVDSSQWPVRHPILSSILYQCMCASAHTQSFLFVCFKRVCQL